MQRMSKDNTPIIPNPTEKVKPFCKKKIAPKIPGFLYTSVNAGNIGAMIHN